MTAGAQLYPPGADQSTADSEAQTNQQTLFDEEDTGYTADFSSADTVNWTLDGTTITPTIEDGTISFVGKGIFVDGDSPAWTDGVYQITLKADALTDLAPMVRYADSNHWVTLWPISI